VSSDGRLGSQGASATIQTGRSICAACASEASACGICVADGMALLGRPTNQHIHVSFTFPLQRSTCLLAPALQLALAHCLQPLPLRQLPAPVTPHTRAVPLVAVAVSVAAVLSAAEQPLEVACPGTQPAQSLLGGVCNS